MCNTTPTTRRDTERRVPTTTVALKEQFVGAKVKTIQGEDPSVTRVNYFKGKDPSKWKTNISTYDVINLGEVYDGIELKLKAYGNNVEKLFYVKPGADPAQIKVRLNGIQPPESPFTKGDSINNSSYKGGAAAKSPLEKGARGLSVNEHGELEVKTELGPVKFTKPIAYQEINGKRVEVEVEYRIQESESNPKSTNSDSKNLNSAIHNPQLEYGFKVAAYDRTKNLIIDPLLASTYLGGSSTDTIYSITLDSSGNVYVTGNTLSEDFPTNSDYSTSGGGSYSDVFVSKLDGTLTMLLASTYLGGSKTDSSNSIVADLKGNIYVVGYTFSSDFPTTVYSFDTSYNDSYFSDTFILKLDDDLSNLLASTYLGGSSYDKGYSIAIDFSENVFITGETSSSNFPTTIGVYNTSYDGRSYTDTFISKLNGDLSNLLASTYFGGTGNDQGNSLAVNSNGNIYIAGWTASKNFPTTDGAFDTSSGVYRGDTFISKFSGDLSAIIASTRLGGTSSDVLGSIFIDSEENIYVVGYTHSSDFPTTSDAYDTSFNNEGYDSNDVFISKLNGDLTTLLASTFLGASRDDYGESIIEDSDRNIYVVGYTSSSDFPTTTGAYDTSYNGSYDYSSDSYDYDVFVSKLNGSLTDVHSSTYLGASNDDRCNSIAISSDGNIYVAGFTESPDFPMGNDNYNTSYNGGSYDTFVSKFDSNFSANKISSLDGDWKFKERLCGSFRGQSLGCASVTDYYTISGDDIYYESDHIGNVYQSGKIITIEFDSEYLASTIEEILSESIDYNVSIEKAILFYKGTLKNNRITGKITGKVTADYEGYTFTIKYTGNFKARKQ